MEELISTLKAAGNISGLGFFVLMFFYALDKGWLRLGKNGNRNGNSEQTPPWAQELLQHFNHETTAQNNAHLDAINRLSEKLEAHNDLEKETKWMIQDIQKNGIPCKKD